MTDTAITGYQIYHGFLSGYLSLSRNRDYLNRINVFPVADGDTGNNMVRTLKTIVSGMRSGRSASRVMNRIAELSIVGARGNSGMILSQFFNGLAVSMESRDTLSPLHFGQVVRDSVTFAYEALDDPREGTILSVIRQWADTVYRESRRQNTLPGILSAALKEARRALEMTPRQLQILEDNSVLDAGAYGFVSFLEGIDTIKERGFTPFSIRRSIHDYSPEPALRFDSAVTHQASEVSFRYCTEILMDGCRISAREIKRRLRVRGDSLIVGEAGSKVRVHIHCDRPWEVVKILSSKARILEQKADDMVLQEACSRKPLSKTAILTDSIADIPRELLDRYQIHVLNLKLSWDSEEYLDRLTITPEQFYRLQDKRTSFPGSSIPDIPTVDALYRFLLDRYENILVLPVAASLSGTWQQFKNCAVRYNREGERIRVVDTAVNSAAQGLLVLETAKAAAGGMDFDQLTAFAESLKKRTKIYVSVSTLKFMVRGGRIKPLTGALASLLHLKPIVSLDSEGRGKAFDKAFTSKGLEKKIASLVENTRDGKGVERFAVVHAASPSRAERFSALVSGILGKKADYTTSISPIVGMHSGRGAVAIGLIEAEEDAGLGSGGRDSGGGN